MAEFSITNRSGKKFIVKYDDCDELLIKKYKWFLVSEKQPYVTSCRKIAKGKYERVYLHRLILRLESKKIFVDHIDGDVLNNKRNNIRICTTSENSKNRRPFGKSKYLGVCKSTGRNKWQATIKANGRYKMLGRFNTEEEAAICYDNAAKIYHGEFANLNFKHHTNT